MTEYLIIVGGICALTGVWIAAEHIRLRIYQRRLAENMARELSWEETPSRKVI